MNHIDYKDIKNKRSSDSSSEMSMNNNSEQESNSFIIQKRKKNKKPTKPHFIETSPNMRFSRQEEKKYSDKHLISYAGLDHDRGCDVIWNVIDISEMNQDQQEKLFVALTKMKNLRHENINTISEVWLKEGNLIFITDSFYGGSIRQCLYKIGIQKLKVIKSWFKMILSGLNYLHKNGLIYSDLNCGRIYFNNNNGVVSIGDLFVATPFYYQFFNEKEYELFTPNCMAPEILLEKEITEKSDVYSLGMLLIEMITIEVPYTDFNMTRAGILQKIRDGIEPSLLDRISDVKAKDYIKKMIDPDPSKRPSVHDLLSDQFLEINEKDDNRKIKLIKIKKKKKKKSIRENMENLSGNKLQPVEKKSVVPFKRDFEENPYFEEVLKPENIIECAENLQCENFGNEIKKKRNSDEKKDNIPQKKEHVPEREKIVTSSHEGGPYSKNCSDVYHTANTDHFHQKFQINDKNAILKTEESVNKKSTHQDQCPSSPPYQIFDEHYNVLLKFLISQDGKLHEIQFAYNLLRDNIPDLIEEVQSEFNFSQDNLNHIYETLKKISIYSKFYKQSDILHDNSA